SKIDLWNAAFALSTGRDRVRARTQVVGSRAKQDDCASLVFEPRRRDVTRLFDNSNHSDHRRRIYSAAVGLVVEADIPSGDWCSKNIAGRAHAVDDFAELPHDLRPLRRSEVQTVGQRERLRSAYDQISTRLGHDKFRAFARVRVAV